MPRTATHSLPPQPSSGGKTLPNDFLNVRVLEALTADRALEHTAIKVETFAGIVQLSGRLPQRYQCTRALEVARLVPGVQGVRNCLKVINRSG